MPDEKEFVQTRETLVRVDERTKAIQNDLTQLRDDLKNVVSNIGETIKETEIRTNMKIQSLEKAIDKIEVDFVKKTEFIPIKSIVYGAISLILIAFFTSVIAFFIWSPNSNNKLPKPVSFISEKYIPTSINNS